VFRLTPVVISVVQDELLARLAAQSLSTRSARQLNAHVRDVRPSGQLVLNECAAQSLD
jgi:hypothetical protein